MFQLIQTFLKEASKESLFLSLPAAMWFLRGETGNPVLNFLHPPI